MIRGTTPSTDLRQLNLIELDQVSGGLATRARMLHSGSTHGNTYGSSGSSGGSSGSSGKAYNCFPSPGGSGMNVCT
jgi:hypothetical protein